MKSYIPEEKLTALIKSSLILMCKTSLTNTSEIEIKGLLGITLDRKNIILVDVSEVITVGEELKHDYSLDDSDLTELEDNYIPESSVKKKAKVKENLRVRLNNPKRLKKDKASKIVHNNVDILKNSNEGETDYTSMTSDELKVEKDKGSGMENHEVTSNTSSSDVQKRVKSADSSRTNNIESASEECIGELIINNVKNLKKHNSDKSQKTKAEHYKCKVCDQAFNRPYNLKRHMMKHTGEHIECKLCTKKCYSKWEFRKHYEISHIKALQCELCDKTFKSVEGLRRHNLSVHVMFFKYRCKVCSRGFHQENQLELHFNSCHLNFRFHCKALGCFYSFKNKKLLCDHKKKCHPELLPQKHNIPKEKSRNDIKQYSCTKCGKTYQWASSLSYHMNVCNVDKEPVNDEITTGDEPVQQQEVDTPLIPKTEQLQNSALKEVLPLESDLHQTLTKTYQLSENGTPAPIVSQPPLTLISPIEAHSVNQATFLPGISVDPSAANSAVVTSQQLLELQQPQVTLPSTYSEPSPLLPHNLVLNPMQVLNPNWQSATSNTNSGLE